METIEFIAKGSHCKSCEKIIIRQAKKIKGVQSATFDWSKEEGTVTFDPNKTDIDEILSKIEEKNYECFILEDSNKIKNPTSNLEKIMGWVFGALGIIILGYYLFPLINKVPHPSITESMSYTILFLVGLITGLHCITMCGGFVVSYTAKNAQENKSSHLSHIYYSLGRLISYTLIGALFGLVGSIIAFTPLMRGIAGILAGLFLVIFGLKMLNLVPLLRRLRVPSPKFVSKHLNQNNTPLIIGLLNGLMIACGPLQAMYVLAAGTGSVIEGAKMLFIFALGTIPALIGFGYATTFISKKIAHKLLKVSGVLVILLGIIMLNNGVALTGTGYDAKSITTKITGTIQEKSGSTSNSGPTIEMQDGYQIIRMDVTYSGWGPDTFVLKKDVPVKWIIQGKEISGCNNAIQVPAFDLEFDIKPGEQIIEFTPTKEGVIPWSCWMGMIPGTFIVKEDISNTEELKAEITANQPAPSSGGCGCGGKR